MKMGSFVRLIGQSLGLKSNSNIYLHRSHSALRWTDWHQLCSYSHAAQLDGKLSKNLDIRKYFTNRPLNSCVGHHHSGELRTAIPWLQVDRKLVGRHHKLVWGRPQGYHAGRSLVTGARVEWHAIALNPPVWWNIWHWGSKWNLHTVCWDAVGCKWGTTSVYFGITYVCFIPSGLPVFGVEPQYRHQDFIFLWKVSFEGHIQKLQKFHVGLKFKWGL